MSDQAAASPGDAGEATVDELVKTLGFKSVEVTYVRAEDLAPADRDTLKKFAAMFGKKEWIDVCVIRPSRMEQYARSLSTEARAVEMCCRAEEGWADTLTPASYEAVAEIALEINSPNYRAWCVRQLKLREMQTPGEITKLRETLQKTIAMVRGDSPSPGSTPTSEASAH